MVPVAVMPQVETAHHHGSHRGLIRLAGESVGSARVDAIFVPTVRPVPYLKEAAAAALKLRCPLVTLHSKRWTNAFEAATCLDPAVDLIAIDVPDAAELRLPSLETSRLLAGTRFERLTDLSTKRNLALVLSHKLRWNRIVFLDDDIRVPEPLDFSKAAGLLSAHSAVGLGMGGFPDNSVVCHAFRAGGGRQETFIGGGALAVDIGQNRSFFPNIYNDDWFFILDAGKRLQSVATVGKVLQYPYDPYRVKRARAEELGDVLAEGIFWLLDQGKPASDGDLRHWQEFLIHRKRFIDQVRDMVASSPGIVPTERQRMEEALTAALGRWAHISPKLCVDYMEALAADQERWQRLIQQIWRQPVQSREDALNSLIARDGTPLTWYTTTSAAVRELGATRKRRSVDASVRTWRPIQIDDLQATIPSPSLSRVPAGFGAAQPVSPLFPRAGDPFSRAAHAQATAKIALASRQLRADNDDDGRAIATS
jgi:hypothetical protein